MDRASGVLSRATLRYLVELAASDPDELMSSAACNELERFDPPFVREVWNAARDARSSAIRFYRR